MSNPSPRRPSDRKPLSSRDLLERIGCNSLDASDAGHAEFCADIEDDMLATLKARFQALGRTCRFTPGMAVRWKPGLRNRRWPHYDHPAIVVEVLAEPILDPSENPGSPYYREPLDLVLGLFIDKGEARGDFLTFHVDGRRFQPWSDDAQVEA